MTYVNDPLTELEAARARVQAQVAQARARTQEAHRAADEARSATATATSVGREVSVIARAGGAVERIDIADAARDLDAATLSRIVTATVRAAQRDAADAALRAIAGTVGEGSPVLARARAQADEQFGSTGGEAR
jgi:DNA-binding protein YbaB